MPIRRAVELIAKLARAVHYAHEHGILHRDIKPGNILVDGKGEPHLTDFGLARLAETESIVTRTIETLGTPSYMTPEQALGNNDQLTQRDRCLWIGRGVLPSSHWPSTFCRRNNLRYHPVALRNRTTASAPVESENRPRSRDHLPQIPGEKPAAPLSVRPRACRRS